MTHFVDVYKYMECNDIIIPKKYAIETGTFMGQTTLFMSTKFEMVYTIDIMEYWTNRAKQYCFNNNAHNIDFSLGNSPDILEKILPIINDRYLIWLDAHDSGEGTGRCEKYGVDGTPLIDELGIIKSKSKSNCNLIVIDDCDSFGHSNYPTMYEVKKMISDINNDYKFIILPIKRTVLIAYIE